MRNEVFKLIRGDKILKFILISFCLTSSCLFLQKKQYQRPDGIPNNAIWWEKKNQWVSVENDGTTTFWYRNGNKESIVKLINDKCEGLYIKYYENGKKKMEGMCKNDLLDGFWQYWWSNSKLKWKGNYINDKQEGWWELYDEEGQPIGDALYKNGTKITEKNLRKK